MNSTKKLQTESAHLMLEWVAIWGENILDGADNGYLGLTSGHLKYAMNLLTEFGITQEKQKHNKYDFISSTVHLPEDYDFHKIFYAFYGLGTFYGYGVRFSEEGFVVANSLKQLFDNLVKLCYCHTYDGFYFWTKKTSNLSYDGLCVLFDPKELVYDQYLQRIKNSRGRGIISGQITLKHKLGIDDESNTAEVEQALTAWLNNWQSNPIVWPEALPPLRPALGSPRGIKVYRDKNIVAFRTPNL